MFKPMLAGNAPAFDKIKYPVLATPKLDGIRCVIWNGAILSRSLKSIPNLYIRSSLMSIYPEIEYFDGELIIPGAKFNQISSVIMSFDGKPNFEYHIFDYISGKNYSDRLRQLELAFQILGKSSICKYVTPRYIRGPEALEMYEQEMLSLGYEGVMIRDLNGPYKYGRSTTKEGWLLKIKRFEDSEAVIIGFEELQINNNAPFIGELGQTKRSHCQENKSAGGVLGALIVKDVKTGVEFNVGTGFDDPQRISIWSRQDYFLGKLIKYKFQPHGTLDKPRSPVFLGFRSKEDMSNE